MHIVITAAILTAAALLIIILKKYSGASGSEPVECEGLKSLGEIHIAGLRARTSNSAEIEGSGVIGGCWQKFHREKIAKKIKNRTSQNIYAVYCEYESDFNGEYTFLIGHKVKDLANVPDGLSGITIPASDYKIIKTARGRLADVVIDAWKYIWTKWKPGENYERTYIADFEEYGFGAMNPGNGRARLYISVKS